MCVLPVNDIKVFLQISWINMAFAELQLSPRIVMNVVDTHFLHDAKTSLRKRSDLVREGRVRWIMGCRKYGEFKDRGKGIKQTNKKTILKVILLWTVLKVNLKIVLY